MASLDLRALRTILADAIGEIKNLKEGNKDLANGIADLEKKYQSNTTALEKTVKATEKLANEGLNTTRVLKEQKTEIGEYSKRATEAEKSITKLTRTVASLKEKLAESNAKLKQQSKEMGASFKDMATMLNEAFYGNGTKKQPNLANFFKKEFATLATTITSEIKNIKMNTTNIGLDIGDGLLKGLSEGVKKGKGSSAGNGISQAMQSVIDAEINKVKDGLKARLAKIASDVGLTTTEGLRDAMKAISESRKDTKDLMAYKDLQVFGSPEAKAQMKQNFAGVIQELVKHQKDIEKYSEKHGQNLTKIEQDRINKIRDLVKSAKAVASSGMAGNDPGGSLDIIRAFAKQANEIKVAQKKSLDGNKQLVDAYVSGEKVKMDAAIRADKIDEMLLQQKMQRQNKLTKSIITTTKQQEAEINKLTTGRTNTKESAGLGKVSSFVVKTDEEKTVLKSINFIKERMLDLKNNESMNLQDRIRLHKSYSAQFQQMTKHLVDQISERKKSENDYINWWKTEGAAGLDARVKKEKEVNDMWHKLLANKEKETIKAEKKAQADRLKAQTEFAEQQLKQEQSLQERLRRLTGKFTEQEKYTKSKKYLELSINNQVKAEVDQANRIQALMQGYQRAKSKAGSATTDADRTKWEDQTKALMAAAERETNVLKEMVYRRLNADRESLASKKKLEKEEKRRLSEMATTERKMLSESVAEQRNKARQQRKLDKEAADNFKIWQKAGEEAARRVSKAWSDLGAAIGLGWRNRNLMESFQQFAHGIRRFGHDAGMMVEQVASRIMYLTATFTALGAGIAGALAYGAKQIYNFGQNIIKTTEEVRGYQIALYGMMGTQSGVNEMLEVAEKVTKTMPIGFKTIQESVKGMVLIGPVRDMLRNTKDVEGVMGSLFKIVVGLSQIQPEWGAKGAIFSLRNALTGDLRSLQRRFELPVRAIYSAEGVPLQDLQYQPEKMVETLDTYISSFYSSETLKMSSNQFSAIMEKMAGNWIKFVKTIGESGFYDLITADLAKIRDAIQEFVDSDDFGKITKQISDSMGNMYEAIRNIASYLGGYIGNMFGITGIQDITDIGGAFEYLAKVMRVIEKLVTSGTLINLVKSIGTDLKNKLVTPIMYVKDLIGEMVQDAIGFGKVVGRVFESIFAKTKGGSGGLIGNKTLEKGLLWTLFFGPGNVSMLFGSITLLINSALGSFINMFNVLLKTIALIRVSWVGAWLAPLAPFLKWGAAILAIFNFDKVLKFADDFGEVFRKVFDEVFKYLENKLSNMILSMANKIADWFPGLQRFIGTPGAIENTYLQYKNEKDKAQGDYDMASARGDVDDFALNAMRRRVKDFEYLMKELEKANPWLIAKQEIGKQDTFSYDKQRSFIETLRNSFSVFAGDSKVKETLGGFWDDLKQTLFGVVDVNTYSLLEMSKELKSRVAKMEKPVVIEGLKESTMAGGLTLLQSMEQLGFNAKITSAFRAGDKKTHGSGLSLDIQDTNKSMMDESLFKIFAEMKSKGYIEEVIAEQSPGMKAFDFTSPLFKEYGIGTMSYTGKGKDRKPVNSTGHFHIQFSEKAKELANIVNAQNAVVGMTSKSMEESIMRAIAEVESASLENYDSDMFVNVNEQGAELLKSISNLDSSMGSITMGIRQHVSKMTDMVNATFNDLKDDEGHMFGPEAITKLQSSYDAEIAKRRRIYDKVSQQYRKDNPLYAQGAIPDSILSPLVAQQAYSDMFVKTAPRTFGKIAAGMGGGLSSPTGMGMGIQGMVAMAVQISKEADFVDRVVNRFDEFNQEFQKTVELARKFSAEYLSDAMFNKTFEYATVPMDRLQETFGRNFDLKAMEEALSITYGIHSNFAATEEEAQQLMKDMVGLAKEGYSYEDAVKKVLGDFANSPEATAEMKQSAEAMSKTFLEYFNNIKESNKELTIQKNIYATMVGDLKKMNIEQLKAAKGQYLGSKSTSVRKGYAAEYRSRIEEGIETDSFDNIFAIGMESAVAEWDNFGTMVLSGAGEVANGMRQAFEDGFFGFMTGEIKNLGDMFRNIGKSILQTISKILAQIAAVSVTKMILGIDVQGGLTSGSSGGLGGLGGIIGSLTGGQGGIGNFIGDLLYGKSKSSGVDLSSVAMNIGGGSSTITGQLLSKAASFIPGANIIDSVIKGGTASKASGGLLSKLGIGKITPLSALGLTAAATFLSQPGRLFGGTKDKTGDAQAALADYNARRESYVNRRASDSLNYYMGGTGSLGRYEFGGIGYNTWTSGDGWFKGPKEKHAATDPSAFLKSLDRYYELLMSAGQSHYSNMKYINKTAETNQLKSLKMQQQFDQQKMTIIRAEYDRYANSSYTAADKYEKMDEYRDKLLEEEYANWQLKEEIIKLEKETMYKQMEYEVFKITAGADSIAMAKVAIEIEKKKLQEYTQGTLEWYDAKMSLMTSERDLAENLRDIAKTTKESIAEAAKQLLELSANSFSIYPQSATKSSIDIQKMYNKMEQVRTNFSSIDLSEYTDSFTYVPTGKYDRKQVYNEYTKATLFSEDTAYMEYQRLKRDNPDKVYSFEQSISTGPEYSLTQGLARMYDAAGNVIKTSNKWITYQIYEYSKIMEKQYDITMEEIIEQIQKDINYMLEVFQLDVREGELRASVGKNIFSSLDNAVENRYTEISNALSTFNDMKYSGVLSGHDADIAEKTLDVTIAEFYEGLSQQIGGVVDAGYINELDTAIMDFVTSIYGGLNKAAVNFYEEIMMTGRKMGLKSNMLGTIRDMEDFSIYNQVMGSNEMAGLKSMMGSNLNMSGYQDPYSAWFDFNKSVIQTRIGNAEEGSEEWFAAQNDLFNLMIENAEKLKEKAENMTRSIEDMLGKIEETMRMRIAEERQTAKGDVYFVDVGSTRNSQQMLDRMLSAVKTNDPEAMKLIEEFKKKMLGIGR